MFKAGQFYKIQVFETGAPEGGLTTHFRLRVIDVEMPLIKVWNGATETIFNTASPAFFSAEKLPEE